MPFLKAPAHQPVESSTVADLLPEDAAKLISGICQPEYADEGNSATDVLFKAQLFADELADDLLSKVELYIENGSTGELKGLLKEFAGWKSRQGDTKRADD